MFGFAKRSRASIPTPAAGQVYLAVDTEGLLVLKKEDGSVVAPETLLSELAATVATKQDASTAATDLELATTTTIATAAKVLSEAALPKSGGTMTGPLVLAGEPTSNLHPATKQFVIAEIAALINGAPGTRDTLKEIADAMSNDESVATALAATVAGKLGAASNLSDLVDAAAARANLGLGSVATHPSTDFQPRNALKALGEVTGATTLNFAQGTFQSAILKGATEFQPEGAPGYPGVLELLVNTGTGFAFTIKGVQWIGSEPTFSTAASQRYLISLVLVNGEVLGWAGLRGKEGAALRSGAGVPESTVGVEGDMYVDTTAVKLYGPKGPSGWGAGTTLKGAEGTPGGAGPTGPEAFLGADKLVLPTSANSEVFKGTGSNEKEGAAVIAEPANLHRVLFSGEKTLTSGVPQGVAIPLQAGKTVKGIVWAIKAEEKTSPVRTHLWVALVNPAGEVIRRSADYTSVANTPMSPIATSLKLRGLLFTEAFEVPANGLYTAVVCEVMSAGEPMGLAAVTGGLSALLGVTPALAIAFPSGQTTPAEFKGTPAQTSASVIPYLALV